MCSKILLFAKSGATFRMPLLPPWSRLVGQKRAKKAQRSGYLSNTTGGPAHLVSTKKYNNQGLWMHALGSEGWQDLEILTTVLMHYAIMLVYIYTSLTQRLLNKIKHLSPASHGLSWDLHYHFDPYLNLVTCQLSASNILIFNQIWLIFLSIICTCVNS